MKPFTSEIVIGLEIHTELATDSKLFCGCSTHGSEEPNTRTCEVCLGMPGSKPVLNKKAVEYALKLCLALNCKISPNLIFSRKSSLQLFQNPPPGVFLAIRKRPLGSSF